MTDYRKQQLIVGLLGATLNSLLPAFILQSEKLEGREIGNEESSELARELVEFADNQLTDQPD
jgi:hypothetical protein